MFYGIFAILPLSGRGLFLGTIIAVFGAVRLNLSNYGKIYVCDYDVALYGRTFYLSVL